MSTCWSKSRSTYCTGTPSISASRTYGGFQGLADLDAAAFEELDVETTGFVPDVDVLGDVHRVVGRQGVGEPHSSLCRGEGQDLSDVFSDNVRAVAVIGGRHGR